MAKSSDRGRLAALFTFEILEHRQLFAAPTASLGADHILRINGTAGGDTLVLSHLLANGKDEIKTTLNRRKSYFATREIKSIEISAGAGDDVVRIDAASAAFRISLKIDGAEGNDTLSGASGNDTISGGAGNDQLFGGKGDDVLAGGRGDDQLTDDRGDNTFDGGVGRNVIRRGYEGPDQFVIGVWGQPSNYAWRWKARGVNTMVAAELMGGRIPLSKWDAEVASLGLNMIRQPSANPADDAKFSNLIAWLAPDEPDVHHTDPAAVQATYKRLKRINPSLPVMLNFSGGHVVGYQESSWKHPYSGWLAGADWSSNDMYPVAGWNLPDRLGLVGQAIDKLRAVDPAKPQFAFIEVGDQGLPWNLDAPGPTPAQFRAEIWNAVIHGARGITYFADAFKPSFTYNSMKADVEAEMIVQNAKLKDLSGVLLSKIDPKGYGLTLPAGMEGTVRTFKGKTYLIVQNLSDQPIDNAQIKIRGVPDGTATVYGENRTVQIHSGQITDSFAPLTPRIYVVG